MLDVQIASGRGGGGDAPENGLTKINAVVAAWS